ncbi:MULTISPECIES: enoyl-CoA hydratase [unclassified Phaeobacter]|uniref:enoyl-CoA hydratase n=1 Tax=unclassified Phaeobacter TaxID=2621772 RepID=UPI003A8B032F
MEFGSDILLCETSDKVARVTMNRPGARNSLSMAMLERLHSAIYALGADDNIHAIVIAGNGPAFCAGHDLKELTAARAFDDGGQVFFEKTMNACSLLMQAIVTCPKPVIAQVHGIATAAGCQLVASCDLAVAASDTRFATPGVNIGLFCSTPMVALSRNVSRKRAMEMLLTGDLISAGQAAEFGLLNKIVEPAVLAAEVNALAQKIASKSPVTLRIGKEAFYKQAEMTLQDAYGYASQVMVANMMKPDAAEGISAFIEKRPPHWRALGG